MPSAWTIAALADIFTVLTTPAACGSFAHSSVPKYWVRLDVSAALSATVTLSSLLALNRSTAYAELQSGELLDLEIQKRHGGIACLEGATDAGTASLVVNAFTEVGGGF